jgi:hypothetical protein
MVAFSAGFVPGREATSGSRLCSHPSSKMVRPHDQPMHIFHANIEAERRLHRSIAFMVCG